MRQCWEMDRDKRPSFVTIRDTLLLYTEQPKQAQSPVSVTANNYYSGVPPALNSSLQSCELSKGPKIDTLKVPLSASTLLPILPAVTLHYGQDIPYISVSKAKNFFIKEGIDPSLITESTTVLTPGYIGIKVLGKLVGPFEAVKSDPTFLKQLRYNVIYPRPNWEWNEHSSSLLVVVYNLLSKATGYRIVRKNVKF